MSGLSPIRVLSVDNDDLIHRAVRYALMAANNIWIVAESEPCDAYNMTTQHAPDVILYGTGCVGYPDDLMPLRNVLDAFPDTRAVVLSQEADDEELFNSAWIGACAYLEKEAIFTELAVTIFEVSAGRYPISDTIQGRPRVAARIINSLKYASLLDLPDDRHASSLSGRETDVLACIASGKSNKEIAYQLGITEQTVKNHLAAVFRKLNISDRTSAAIYALKHHEILAVEDASGIGGEETPIYVDQSVPSYVQY